MRNPHAPLWTIEELSAEVARALATGYEGAASGRVRDVPDLRTIRYYTTLGLIDRPAAMRGRTALYGPRHLLQLVAIKRLQARGLSLAQVQEQLLAASDVMLGRLANEAVDSGTKAQVGKRNEFPSTDGKRNEFRSTDEAGPVPKGKVRPRSFWKSRPVELPEARATASLTGTGQANVDDKERSGPLVAYQEIEPLHAIGLANQVTLLLASTRRIDPGELPAIRQAAAPLIRHLEERRLIQPRPKGEGNDHVDSTTD
jgi:hypothetical protein